MKRTKSSRRATILIAIGLLFTTTPLLLKDYINISDFFRGVLPGVGIGLMITALIIQKRKPKDCCVQEDTEPLK
jgi:hypothetical protein